MSSAHAFFDSLQPSTIKLGLERMERALEAVGHPQRRFPAVHVAGTNGKGSTCAFVESCLRAEGYKVGLYTSPHLVRLNERFWVGGREIPDAQLDLRVRQLLELWPRAGEELTYFEFGTLLAFWHFAQESVDVAVVETGLGGRLDATRLCVPKVTAITALAMDHMELLGDTLPKIAREKAGIFRPGVPAVTCAQPAEAAEVLRSVAREVGAPLRQEGVDFSLKPGRSGLLRFASNRHLSGDGDGDADGLRLGLRGEHQHQNAAVALACLETLFEQGLPVREEAVRRGLANVRWPGRLEVLGRSPTVLVDGAHNPAGVEALLQALDALYPLRRVHLLFAVLKDKDFRPMLRALVSRADTVHLVPLENPRALSPAEAAAEARSAAPDVKTFEHRGVAEALESACKSAGPQGLVLGAGSLVLVGALRARLAGGVPKGIRA